MKELIPALGPVTAVIGAQWGDEGKGKVVDALTEHFDIVARANGGANAGHTIVVGGKKYVFRLLPSGCLHSHVHVVLGSGLVIHLPTLLEEIDILRGHGIDILPRLHISREAHIVFAMHKEIDAALEAERESTKGEGIGTTKKGIGPAYMDKASRAGIRLERLGEDVTDELHARKEFIKRAYGVDVDVAKEVESMKHGCDVFGGCVEDTMTYLHNALDAKKRVIIEGAQATMLDIDHGTYPYVTSSSTTAAGALQGLGLPPQCVTACIGVAKAYCTRVGGGPFPTEADEKQADRLRERGGEYGSVTGRPRRTGWLNIDDLHVAARMNGVTHWNLTKLDVLDEEEVIPVMTGEEWKELPGWKTTTSGITDFAALPVDAQAYVQFMEEQTKIPVALIGTGPGREEMITRY